MLRLSRYHRMEFRAALGGNTLAEYALPLALVVVSGGVIASMVNFGDLIPAYMASASGSSVSGSTINTKVMGADHVSGALGTGAAEAGSGTYFSSGSGAFNIAAGGSSGSSSDDTVGNDGNGWQLINGKLPAPVIGKPTETQQDSLGYRKAAEQAENTARQAQKAIKANDTDTLKRLLAERAADAARVDTEAMQNPEEVEKYGGETAKNLSDADRGDTSTALVEGDADTVDQSAPGEVDELGKPTASSSSSGFDFGFFMFNLDGLIALLRNPNDTANAVRPDLADPFIEQKQAMVIAEVIVEAQKQGFGPGATPPP